MDRAHLATDHSPVELRIVGVGIYQGASHIGILSRSTAAHLKGMRADIGQVRFRVLEVGGAVAADAYPVNFSTAQTLADRLLEMADGAQPPQTAT